MQDQSIEHKRDGSHQQSRNEQTPHRGLFRTGLAAMAGLTVLAGGLYVFNHKRTWSQAQTDFIHPVASAVALPTTIQSVYIPSQTPAHGRWTPRVPQAVKTEIWTWLNDATPYTKPIPTSQWTLHSNAPGSPVELHLLTPQHQEIVITPANHVIETTEGQIKPQYIAGVIAYRVSGRTTFLQSQRLYAWLRDMQWKRAFVSKRNPLFNTALTLPDGRVVTLDKSLQWKHLSVNIQMQGIPQAEPRYYGVVGNHSRVLSHSQVSTSAGPATLVLNERTPPAASRSTKPTYEYWVIVYGSQYAYAIEAVVSGGLSVAKADVMELLGGWKVPK